MHLALDFYETLRARGRAEGGLADPAAQGLQEGAPPPERWLQQVWRHQRLRRQELQLADGTPVRILHPGFWNREAGPDFRGAVIQFGTEPPRTGDVELDRQTAGWHHHGHSASSRFQQVILQVVWDEADVDRARPPVMALEPYLDAPLAELSRWLDLEAPRLLPESTLGQCHGPLRDFAPDALVELLRQAARVRLERKSAEMSARARQTGWHGALWEGLMAALGYKHNAWAFRRLAELVPYLGSQNAPQSPEPLHVEARLLGLAGLLPQELTRDSDPHLRLLWDCWWRERDSFAETLLPAALWRLSGIRPANRPERRLALAAGWWLAPDLPSRLETWLRASSSRSAPEIADDLQALLTPSGATPGSYWQHHWTLRSARLAVPHALLGSPRVTDLAMNVILPWFWARAKAGRADPAGVVAAVERCWENWPAGEDNSVLRLTRQRLFGTQRPRLPARAVLQQGLLQVTRDFCDPGGALCVSCRFPQLIQAELGRPQESSQRPPPLT